MALSQLVVAKVRSVRRESDDRAIFLKLVAKLDWNKAKLEEVSNDFDVVTAYLSDAHRREVL